MVGRDMRTTSPELSAAFADGVLSRGADVVDIGLASTDGLWFASGSLGLPGAMFTASHNPGELQRDQVLSPGGRSRSSRPELVAIRDARPGRPAGTGAAADRAPGPRRTCSARTRATCCHWSTCPASVDSRSSSTPATGWAG